MPCTLDEVLGPPTTPEGRNDEKALLEQLVTFLSGTDESELAKLDKALGIDKLVQVSVCQERLVTMIDHNTQHSCWIAGSLRWPLLSLFVPQSWIWQKTLLERFQVHQEVFVFCK